MLSHFPSLLTLTPAAGTEYTQATQAYDLEANKEGDNGMLTGQNVTVDGVAYTIGKEIGGGMLEIQVFVNTAMGELFMGLKLNCSIVFVLFVSLGSFGSVYLCNNPRLAIKVQRHKKVGIEEITAFRYVILFVAFVHMFPCCHSSTFSFHVL